MAALKFRHELKHYINTSDYYEISKRLRLVAKPDENMKDQRSYSVRSLYFDNFNDFALREKIDGVNKREKFRIRFYNNDASFIRLEKKMKENGLCAKLSTKITKEQCENILNGDIDFMRSSEDKLLLELYSKMHYQVLRPKIIIDYKREAYVYSISSIRVTIDKEIRTSSNIEKFLEPDLLTIPVSRDIILEIKYNEFLPQIIADITQLKNRKMSAYSKYAAARLI